MANQYIDVMVDSSPNGMFNVCAFDFDTCETIESFECPTMCEALALADDLAEAYGARVLVDGNLQD